MTCLMKMCVIVVEFDYMEADERNAGLENIEEQWR